MIILSKLADYGVIVATHLATHPDRQATAAAVAAATRLPQATVAKLLKALAHAGLVTATRGAAGGYRLARRGRRRTRAPRRRPAHGAGSASRTPATPRRGRRRDPAAAGDRRQAAEGARACRPRDRHPWRRRRLSPGAAGDRDLGRRGCRRDRRRYRHDAMLGPCR